MVTRGDLDYSALWILYAATPLAKIEVMGASLLADREVIPQAMKLNPAFYQTIYVDLLNAKKTRKNVQAQAIDVVAIPYLVDVAPRAARRQRFTRSPSADSRSSTTSTRSRLLSR